MVGGILASCSSVTNQGGGGMAAAAEIRDSLEPQLCSDSIVSFHSACGCLLVGVMAPLTAVLLDGRQLEGIS